MANVRKRELYSLLCVSAACLALIDREAQKQTSDSTLTSSAQAQRAHGRA